MNKKWEEMRSTKERRIKGKKVKKEECNKTDSVNFLKSSVISNLLWVCMYVYNKRILFGKFYFWKRPHTISLIHTISSFNKIHAKVPKVYSFPILRRYSVGLSF